MRPLICRAQADTAPHGVLPRPKSNGGRLTENHRTFAPFGKAAAMDEGNRKGFEVVRLHEGVVQNGLGSGRPFIERGGCGPIAAIPRWARMGDHRYPRHCRQPGTNFIDQETSLRASVFGRLGKLKVQGENPLPFITSIDADRADRTSNRHAAGNHQHQRKGNLRRDQSVLQPPAAGRRRTASGAQSEPGLRTLIAGANPDNIPATSEMTETKPRISRSGVMSNTSPPYSPGTAFAIIATAPFRIAQVTRRATPPASAPINALSDINCRTRRSRLAPKDIRVRISFSLDRDRASCKLPTFAQATTSTIPAAAMMSNAARVSPPYSFSGRGNGEPGQTITVAGFAHSERGSWSERRCSATELI